MRIHGLKINENLWGGLRKCQQEGIRTGLKYLNEPVGEKSCLISLPTGAGKSGVICTLSHVSKHERVLILCHRRAVCDQLIKQLSGSFFNLVAPDETIPEKSVFSTVDSTENSGIYVSTFQKLQSMEADDLQVLKNNIDLLIIDEGHAEPSPLWSQIARGLGAHKIIITATPYRNDLFQFDINPASSYVFTFEKALDDEVLVEPDFSIVSRNELVARVTEQLQRQLGTKCIVKCKEFSDVEEYVDLFSRTLKTLGIHDRYSGDDRKNVKSIVSKKIAESDWDVIVHQRKLDEGVDIPQAKTLVLTYPVSSGRELVQTVGRVVRLYENTTASVIEVGTESNKRMWENYREFDTYISGNHSAKKFLSSLDTAGLIDSYLSAFPDVSYFESGYKRKFDLKSFDPEQSLKIPLASVCFVQKRDGFTLESMMDAMYWFFSRKGELVDPRSNLFGANLLLSISFNNSKFLKDELFFEPSFEVFLAKEVGDYVAIFDSRSRDFSYEKDFLLGAAVDVDKLLNLANRSDVTRTKEAHTRTVNTANSRPEGISLKGVDLEKMAGPQGNSSYALTTLKVDNINKQDKKESSYYLGVGSGRVSDQKKRNFSLEELCSWIDDVEQALGTTRRKNSQFISSYAKPLNEVPTEDPVSVLIDLTDQQSELFIFREGEVSKLENSFILFSYANGIAPLPGVDAYKVSLEYDDKEEVLLFRSDEDILYSFDEGAALDGDADKSLLDLFNKSSMKVLYHNGLSYLNGDFYRITLPSELAEDFTDSKMAGSIFPLPELQNPNFTEKDIEAVTSDGFGANSIFWLIDQLKSSGNPNSTLDDLGVFHNYIPDIDLLLCTDMGTEPADFIIASPTKLAFVHVKCSKTNAPRSSAGAIAEVGGQALKNMEMLISHDRELMPANRGRLTGYWPSPDTDNAMKERLRLFEGEQFENANDDEVLREDKLEESLALIALRRQSAAVKKEIWIVVGNGFSRSHFVEQMAQGRDAVGESLQAFQLLDSWMANCASFDVDLKLFVSP
jgi:superfamily II DNA or RNA helicase